MRPTAWNRITDRVHLFFRGGIRVRIWNDPDTGFQCLVAGAAGRDFERLLAYLHELRPSGDGILDARNEGKRITFRVSGPIADEGFEQRLRNMLLNL